MRSIEISELQKGGIENLLLIDTRRPEVFVEGFIKNSVSVFLDESFKTRLEEIVEDAHRIVFITGENDVEALDSLVKGSGMGNVEGFLNGGFDAWKESGNKFDMLIGIEPDEFAMDYQYDEFYLLDVRPKEEFDKEHVEDAENIPLADYAQAIDEMGADGNYYIYGATLPEAVTAASLFKRFGLERVRVVMTGYESIKTARLPFYEAKKKPGRPPESGLGTPVKN